MSYIYSYTGRKVGPAYDAPCLVDVAVQLGRICRFAGACRRFYPVLLHSFVVADLLPEHLKIYGLLHDATECAIGDIPSPWKPDEMRKLEGILFDQLLHSLGVSLPSAAERAEIKRADIEALRGEAWTVGPPGLTVEFPERSERAERLVNKYVAEFGIGECLWPEGKGVQEFLARFEVYALERLALA